LYILIFKFFDSRRALFITVQKHSTAYCRCREAVKLWRFLLSPYSLIGTCNSVQNCTLRWLAEVRKGRPSKLV
jgi:hypothetical protein